MGYARKQMFGCFDFGRDQLEGNCCFSGEEDQHIGYIKESRKNKLKGTTFILAELHKFGEI